MNLLHDHQVMVSIVQPPILCNDEKKNCKFLSEDELNQLMIAYCERLMNGVDGMSKFIKHLSEETMKPNCYRVEDHDGIHSEIIDDMNAFGLDDLWTFSMNDNSDSEPGMLNSLTELSDEILQLIFQFVDNRTLLSIMLSCSMLYEIVSQPQLWKDKCENEGLLLYNYYFKKNTNSSSFQQVDIFKKFYTNVIAKKTVFDVKHSNGKFLTFNLAYTSSLTCFSHFGVIYIDPSLYFEFNVSNDHYSSQPSLLPLLADTLFKCYNAGLKMLWFLIDFGSLHDDELKINLVKEVLHNSLQVEVQRLYNQTGYLGSPTILGSNTRTLQGIIDHDDGGTNLLTHILTEISKLSNLTRSIRMQNYKRSKQKTVKIVNHWSPYTKLPPKQLELIDH
ncbi:hypothetical protein C9374_009724 [Naegleria lovaniensis]|uniref:F-box domain-containing protein n=1 Tax=Naegleria lovaniensis TaxID=51637 RepID=A0AA88H5H4_NAELO|nr:uncharacterized protein C9374_009724 [Naegleria lovaniensis]KAG2393147.1 hypothetical protein C9374_009724 [Naegleria lovaniensis]